MKTDGHSAGGVSEVQSPVGELNGSGGGALLNETDGNRIAVSDPVAGPHRGDDTEHDSDDSDGRPNKESYDKAGRHCADYPSDHEREVEIQRLLALVIDEGALVLLDKPDDQRADEAEDAQ